MSEPAQTFGKRQKTLKAFNCPTCGGTIRLRAAGISITAACEHCRTLIDAADPNLRILQQAETSAVPSDLDIGTRAELFGITWEVIGYVRKAVSGTIYRWDEYLLFNPWHGFRFLSKSAGHWTFFKRMNAHIPGIGRRNQVTANGRTFNLFNRDIARVEAVKGEFYWRLKTGDESRASDYINAPYMLSCDETDDELNVSLGVYVKPQEIEKAFAVRVPQPQGIGACQPPPFRYNAGNIMKVAGLALAAALIIQVVSLIGGHHEQVLAIEGQPVQPAVTAASSLATGTWSDTSTGQPADTGGETLSTEPFRLSRDGTVRIRTETTLNNAWAEFSLSLVNEKTGQVYALRQGLEHYYGVSGGESWSEGSNHAESYLSHVPAGDYRLLIDADSDVLSKHEPLSFSLILDRGVTDWSNLWASLLLIAAFPTYVIGRRFMFESARWSDSAYSPAGGLKVED
jgi:hypothetical protein